MPPKSSAAGTVIQGFFPGGAPRFHIGKKRQKWGTQSEQIDGKWILSEVDPTITDAQRADWNVPPLAEAIARTSQMNAKP